MTLKYTCEEMELRALVMLAGAHGTNFAIFDAPRFRDEKKARAHFELQMNNLINDILRDKKAKGETIEQESNKAIKQ